MASKTSTNAHLRKSRPATHFGDAYVQTTILLDYDAIVQVKATPERKTRLERLGPFPTPEQARAVGDHRLSTLRRQLAAELPAADSHLALECSASGMPSK